MPPMRRHNEDHQLYRAQPEKVGNRGPRAAIGALHRGSRGLEFLPANVDTDIEVNVIHTKKLTKLRDSGKDDLTRVRPVRHMTLERVYEYVQADKLIKITPKAIRLCKRLLRETDRRRAKHQKA